jgi:glutaredoxin
MADFIIYTKSGSPSCVEAMKLLKKYKFSFDEICIKTVESEEREKLFRKTRIMTFPQIFDVRGRDEVFIGGFSDLKAMLDPDQKASLDL